MTWPLLFGVYTSGKSRSVFVKKFSEVRDNCATIDRRKFIVSNGSRNKDSHPYRKRHGIIHSADICLRLCALLARVYFPEKLPSDTASRFIPLFGFHENFSEDLSRVFLIFHRIRKETKWHIKTETIENVRIVTSSKPVSRVVRKMFFL